jgi:hypothetical protein
MSDSAREDNRAARTRERCVYCLVTRHTCGGRAGGAGESARGAPAAREHTSTPPPVLCGRARCHARRTQRARVKSGGSAWVHERTLAARRVLTQSLHRRGVGRRGVSEAAGGVSRAHCAPCAGRARAPRAALSTASCARARQARPRGVAAARRRSRPARGGVGAAGACVSFKFAAAGVCARRCRPGGERRRAHAQPLSPRPGGCQRRTGERRGVCRSAPRPRPLSAESPGGFRQVGPPRQHMLTPPCSRPAPRRRRCAAGVRKKRQGAT